MENRIKNVDFLRFIFAVMIVMYHCCEFFSFKTGNLVTKYLPGLIHGYICVDFFFVIAGFFLFANLKQVKTFDFALKRFYRLAPLIWFYIILSIIYCIFVHSPIHFDNYFLKIFLFSNIGFSPKTDTALHWFIPVIFWVSVFYFYIAKIFDKKYLNLIIWVITICSLGCLLNYKSYDINLHSKNIYLFINAGVIRGLAGMGIGYFINELCNTNVLEKCSKFGTVIISLCELYLIYSIAHFMLFSPKLPGKTSFLFILWFSILLFLFLRRKGLISKLLNNNSSIILGAYSYAIYVMQPFVNRIFKHFIYLPHAKYTQTHSIMLFIINVLVVIIFGILTHYIYEKPFNRFLHNKVLKKQDAGKI